MLKPQRDAFGQLVSDYHRGIDATEIIERDDGWIGVSGGPSTYFAPFAQWPPHQRRAMRWIRGRVLDVGCGAGRLALHLQRRGHEVLAVDNSPLAIQTAKLRGVRAAKVMDITQLSRRLGLFDTIALFGNNFGLLANPSRAGWLLRRFGAMTPPSGCIVAEVLDPYVSKAPEHRRYHRRNRQRGRLPGQVRIRARYKEFATPWFDYLFVSVRELRIILRETPWELAKTIPSKGGTYMAILAKRAGSV